MEHVTVNTRNNYPWHMWTDGTWRAVFPQTHFGVSVDSFVSRLSHHGFDTGNKIDVIRLPEQEGVAFRITPAPAPIARREGPTRDTRLLVRPLTAFIALRCIETPTARCLTQDLRGAFRTYLVESEIPTDFTVEAFGRALKIVCPSVLRTKQRDGGRLVNVYTGVTLKQTGSTVND